MSNPICKNCIHFLIRTGTTYTKVDGEEKTIEELYRRVCTLNPVWLDISGISHFCGQYTSNPFSPKGTHL